MDSKAEHRFGAEAGLVPVFGFEAVLCGFAQNGRSRSVVRKSVNARIVA